MPTHKIKAVIYDPNDNRFMLKTIAKPGLETPFDVMVEVSAVGLNPVDAKINHWVSMVEPTNRDIVGGLDVSGTIVAKGSQVYNWNIGDHVLYHGDMRRRQGGFAPLCVHDSRTLTKHPNISAVQAAASPCAGWTAFRALNDKLLCSIKESILIYGASGGVGSYALQLCRYFNFKTIIAVCSEQNFEYAYSLGATHCVDYQDPQIRAKISFITNAQGLDCIIDCVGGPAQKLTSTMLGFDGQLVELVSTIDSSQHQNMFERGLSLSQLSLGSGHVYGEKGKHSITQAGTKMNMLLEKQIICPPHITTITINDIPEQLEQMRQGHSKGKYVAIAKH
ncbi:zinc-binding dehydrogenase [Celerinatantimonas sp. MCCC 1A17872]|uniref:zinc-binding dehydrogenase n=1 Tax=Celerinatantimonas sp. MCCC 1A17872 TaxID=3177514 RepID=UPI0038CB882D